MMRFAHHLTKHLPGCASGAAIAIADAMGIRHTLRNYSLLLCKHTGIRKSLMIKPLIYAPSKPIRKRKNVFLQRLGTNALFLLPALFFFTCFVIYPLLSGVYYSMTNWNGIDLTPQFVGLQNFLSLWHDAEFLSSMRVTLTFAFFVTLIQNSLALLLALALNRFMRFSAAFRVLFLIPTLISILAMGYIWSYIYSPLFGFVDAFLIHVGLSQWAQDWLGVPHSRLVTFFLVGSWQGGASIL